jgi:hypothetical protein
MLGLAFTGCTETRVIHNHPMFGSLPGAQVNEEVTVPKGYQAISLAPRTVVDPKDPAKKVVLATTGRQLMVSIYNALVKRDRDIFLTCILSSHSHEALLQENSSGSVLFDELYERSDDVVELFNRLPMAEYTPGVYLEKIAPSVFRVKLSGQAAKGLYYTGFDMELDQGTWHLVRFLRN